MELQQHLVVGLILGMVMFLAAECGFRLGRRDSPCPSTFNSAKASVMALVGLLLAFSYNMASGHYDQRLQTTIREAKAVKLCWLRTDLLAEPSRSRARQLLQAMLDDQLATWSKPAASDEARRTARHLAEYQSELWSLAVQELEARDQSAKAALLALSISDVGERMNERASAVEIRVPTPIYALLITGVLLAAFLVGFSSGEDKRRVPLFWVIVLFLMVAVLLTTFDLDHPGRGFIPDRYQPLDLVRASMQSR